MIYLNLFLRPCESRRPLNPDLKHCWKPPASQGYLTSMQFSFRVEKDRNPPDAEGVSDSHANHFLNRESGLIVAHTCHRGVREALRSQHKVGIGVRAEGVDGFNIVGMRV